MRFGRKSSADGSSERVEEIENGTHRNTVGQSVGDHDDPLANVGNAEIDYKTLRWWSCGYLMIAETISLGVLSLPHAVATLGLVPGLLIILILGLIATYTGYVIGQFKLKFPAVTSFADAGELIGGPILREVLGAAQIMLIIFIQAAHVLSFALAMNSLTDHITCSIVWTVIGFLICFALTIPRTLQSISYLSIASCISVLAAVVIATCGIALHRPDDVEGISMLGKTETVREGMGPVLNIILAYAGHVAFFGFIAELKNPKEFTKALVFLQSTCTVFYMAIAAMIYYFAGPDIKSPALGSAPDTFRKAAWGVAMPTIIIAGVVNGHVACKLAYVRIFKGTNVIHTKTFKAIGSWIAIVFVSWLVGWVIAEAVPNFNLLLGLISTLFCAWFSYGISGLFWIYMNKGNWFSTKWNITLFCANVGILVLGTVISALGMYSSGYDLAHGKGGKPFKC